MNKLLIATLLLCASAFAQYGGDKSNTIPSGGGANNLVFINTCNKNQNTNVTTTTINLSCVANPTVGHYVLVGVNADGVVTGLAGTDTLGNTWVCTVDTSSGAGPSLMGYCQSHITVGASADTLTLTWTSGTSMVVFSSEWSGAVSTSTVDQETGNSLQPSTTAWTLPSVTTTQAAEAIIAFGNMPSGCTSIAAGSGYTIPTNGKIVTQYGFEEYQIVNSINTYAPTATMGTACIGGGLTISIKSS